MSTTNLFVELIVIGVGAAGWAALFVMSALGYDPSVIRGVLSEPAGAVPALVVVYLLGIVTDRLADTSLHSMRAERKRKFYFATEEEALRDRGFVLARSAYFAAQFEYSRSRQRICRGWIFNSVLLAISLNVFLLARPGVVPNPSQVRAVATSALILLGVGCWLAWEKLADTELKRVRDQARVLRELDATGRAGS